MEIRRGYVHWVDSEGRHKEELYKHPDLLKNASEREKRYAEELRALNGDSEDYTISHKPAPLSAAEEEFVNGTDDKQSGRSIDGDNRESTESVHQATDK